jgi:hypothetical protein
MTRYQWLLPPDYIPGMMSTIHGTPWHGMPTAKVIPQRTFYAARARSSEIVMIFKLLKFPSSRIAAQIINKDLTRSDFEELINSG